ncbi:peptidoglycan-binding protein [Dyella humi]|uniref:Peptidoglycan-binding protein n=1 Tax=Dyella humi TaxID=1770547 RepID=A0ABW8IK08_9GAMM
MTSNENSDYLLRAAMSNGIEDADELANFMGQMQIESASFKSMNENLHYSGDGLIKHFSNRNGITDLDKANEIASKGPEAVADAIYGGSWGREHLGNTEPGDGWKYHGRGYVQLTGREEYTKVGKALGIDLVNYPELASAHENAAQIAIYYWKSKVVANGHQRDVTGATHDINGGEKGLAERKAAAIAWEAKLVSGYVPDAPSVQSGREGALKQGALGEAVSALQAELTVLGYIDNRGQALQPDGHFGRNTEAAVRAFQSDHGLIVDGIVGKNTLEALHGQRQLRSGIPALTAELEDSPQRDLTTASIMLQHNAILDRALYPRLVHKYVTPLPTHVTPITAYTPN